MVYSVPDEVAEHLEEYCLRFCNTWLRTSKYAEKYRVGGGLCYNEANFIEYLNKYIFPNKQSLLIENLGWIDFNESLQVKYSGYPKINF